MLWRSKEKLAGAKTGSKIEALNLKDKYSEGLRRRYNNGIKRRKIFQEVSKHCQAFWLVEWMQRWWIVCTKSTWTVICISVSRIKYSILLAWLTVCNSAAALLTWLNSSLLHYAFKTWQLRSKYLLTTDVWRDMNVLPDTAEEPLRSFRSSSVYHSTILWSYCTYPVGITWYVTRDFSRYCHSSTCQTCIECWRGAAKVTRRACITNHTKTWNCLAKRSRPGRFIAWRHSDKLIEGENTRTCRCNGELCVRSQKRNTFGFDNVSEIVVVLNFVKKVRFYNVVDSRVSSN